MTPLTFKCTISFGASIFLRALRFKTGRNEKEINVRSVHEEPLKKIEHGYQR